MSRAFVFGDNVDTDLLAPGKYLKLEPAVLARHCLEAIRPNFTSEVCHGDFIVAGSNFGLGSSREQAAVSLKLLGVKAVFARSFARIFYRNAINLGLPVISLPENVGISDGDMLHFDLREGILTNRTTSTVLLLETLPPHLLAMIADGGLIPHLRRTSADFIKEESA